MKENSEENFGKLLEQSLVSFNKKEGQIVEGTVLFVKNDSVVIDVGLKSEGRIPIREFFSPGEENNIEPGDKFDVLLEKLENKDGEAMLSREKARKEESWINLEKCLEKKEQITGVITGRVKGGFTVDINGAVAFLPGSQVDLRPITDISPLLNKPQPMLILKMDKFRGNIVVSRRAILEESREADRSKLLSDINEGVQLKGIVKNITDYGVFVDLGGLDGLLHVTDLSWERINHPSEILKIGDEIDVLVIKYDLEKRRISLGLKQCVKNPWEEFKKSHKVNEIINGKIKNITEFGIFVELPDALNGMIHLSDIDWEKAGEEAIKDYKVDQEIKVKILEIDVEKERVSLGIKQLTSEKNKNQELLNKVVTTVVKIINDNEIEVQIDEKTKGFIKRTNLAKLKSDQKTSRFAIDEKIDAKIIGFNKRKKSYELSIKELEIQEEKEALKQYGSSSSGASLGDILGAALEVDKEKKKKNKTKDKK